MPASPVATLLALLAVALPFLFPFSAPPLPNLWPLAFSWACIAVLVALAWSKPAPLDRWARRLAGGLVLAALLSAVIGLAQYFGEGADLVPGYAGEIGQAQGDLRQRNQLASLLNLGCWAALWLWVRRSPKVDQDAWARVGLAAVLALLAVACAATASRTGAMQWLLMAGLLLLWWRTFGRGVWRWGLYAVTVYGLAAWLLPQLLQRVQGAAPPGVFERLALEADGCHSRSVLWSNVLTLIAQRPWGGWGWGELDYAHYMTLFSAPRFCELLDNAHNLPLQLAVELGLPLALLLCGGALWLGWRAHPWREAVPARQLAWGVLGLIGLHSLLEYPLWYGPFQLTALFALALLSGGWVARVLGCLRHWPRLVALVLGMGLALGGYLLWDYHRVRQLYLAQELRDPFYREHTLAKVGNSWAYADAVNFAVVNTLPLTPESAARVHALALSLLHFSPEPRVIEALIESDCLLGLGDEAAFHQLRYRAAWPQDYANWRQEQTRCARVW